MDFTTIYTICAMVTTMLMWQGRPQNRSLFYIGIGAILSGILWPVVWLFVAVLIIEDFVRNKL